MKLIKCVKCGRPFYDNKSNCPYCGAESSISANNFITEPITSPESRKTMEAVLAGTYYKEAAPAPEPAKAPEPVIPNLESASTPEAPVVPDMSEAPAPSENISEPIQERAEAMAAIESQAEAAETPDIANIEELLQVESEEKPRKRHGWIWIIIIIIILAIAAAVYLKWDFVYPKVSSLLHLK